MSFPNITNIYELLDQDGEEGVARLPPKKEVVAKPAAAPIKTAAPVKSVQQSSNRTQSPKGERRQGDGQRRNNNNNPRPPRPQGGEQGENVEHNRRAPADRQNRGEKGERDSNYRRNTQAAGEFVGNKRVQDRKSATGRGDGQGRENKRGGKGRGGWGANDASDTIADDIKAASNALGGENIIQGEGVADNKGTDAAAEKLEEQTPKPESEEDKKKREDREKEEKQVSWTDYQKQLAEKKSQSTLLQAAASSRKANEGVDDKTAKKWNTYEQIKRDDVTAPKSVEEKKTEVKAKKQTVQFDKYFGIKESPKPQFSNDRQDNRDRDRDQDRKGGKKNFDKKGGNPKKQGGQGQAQGQAQQPQTGAAADEKPIFDSASFPTLIKN